MKSITYVIELTVSIYVLTDFKLLPYKSLHTVIVFLMILWASSKATMYLINTIEC